MAVVRRLAVVILAVLLQCPLAALAQSYPTRPVRVIVVFPPGGSNDVTARIVFAKLPEIMGQQFVIDNRGGASGTIGAAVVAKSPPDGYTVMVQSTTHIANAYAYKGKLQYDTLGDFIGVTPLARQVGMLVVHPSLPVKSTRELVALAKKRPGEVTYGSAGLGSYTHLAMVLFTSLSKTNILHVPYKGGGPSAVALISGEVQSNIGTIGSLFPHIKSGKVRPLGVTSSKRASQFPNVPAIAESIPGFEFTAWVGSFLPKGTPKPIVDSLNAGLKKALADRDVASKLSAQTLDPMYTTPEEFAVRLKADYERYGTLMKAIGLN
jgi:tripartite-type tricarboxylate transporter receptor subunit TctC